MLLYLFSLPWCTITISLWGTNNETCYLFNPSNLCLEFRKPKEKDDIKLEVVVLLPISFGLLRLEAFEVLFHVCLYGTDHRELVCEDEMANVRG